MLKTIKHLIIVSFLLLCIFTCSMPTNPVSMFAVSPYLEDFGTLGGKQYIVYTKEQIIWIMNNPSAMTSGEGMKLMTNIDFGGQKIEGIEVFNGLFDGNGKTISDFKIEQQSVSNVGFINKLDVGGEVKNLTIKNPVVVGSNQTGGLVGFVKEGGKISNCFVVGGKVESTGRSVGGLIGKTEGTASRPVEITGVKNIGCEVLGKISHCGGIVGSLSAYSKISKSVNTGNVSATPAVGAGANVGGIVGENKGEIFQNYNSGRIQSTGASVGGISGNAWGGGGGSVPQPKIYDNYNRGSISGSSSVGGILGDNTSSFCSTNYNIGNVSGPPGTGGIVGENSSGSIINANYFLKTSTVNAALNGVGSGSGGGSAVAITNEADLGNTTLFFTAWDFSSIWKIKNINAIARPVLRGVGDEGQ